MSSILGRFANGRLETAHENVWQELLDWLDEAKRAYNIRLRSGNFHAAKERADTKQAFLEFALGKGVKRGDALALYRRHF